MHPHPSSEHPSPGKRDKQVATMIGRSLPLLSGTLLIVSLLYLLVTFAATHGGAPASGFLALYCIYLGVLVLTGSLLVRKQWLASLLMSSLLLLFSLLYFILPSLL